MISAETAINSLLLALGLALEAFMVALANGLKNANMGVKRACLFAAVFALCHALALAVGFALVKSIADSVAQVESVLTWIAVAVLLFLGIKMMAEGLSSHEQKNSGKIAEFAVQSAVASFDAFAVGLTVPDYGLTDIAFCASTIALVIIIFFGVGFAVGKKFGMRFKKLAAFLGGLVFIGIAVEIVVSAILSNAV